MRDFLGSLPELGRRKFLASIAAVAGSGALLGCASDSSGKAGDGADADVVDERLETLRRALAKSPDHLAARAAELVKAKDATGIVRFVRDSVAVLVPLVGDLPTDSLRFGARGALRAGAGSFRDRAELLVTLLTAAGFGAKVMQAALPGLESATVYARRSTPFEPDLELLRGVAGALGVALPAKFSDDLAAVSAVEAAVEAISAALPAERQVATGTPATLPSAFPIVEFQAGTGAKSWAVALAAIDVVSDAPSGLVSASPPRVPTVKLAVSVGLRPPPQSLLDPAKLYEVIAGEWAVDDLVGRNVSLTFAPPVAAEQALTQTLDSFPVRMPVLRLHSLEPLPATVAETLGGFPVSLGGAVYTPDEADPKSLIGPYGVVPQPLSASQREQARARVASLTLTVSAAAFPDIDLQVSALDASGKLVDGLAGDDFTLKEGTAPLPLSLLNNAPPEAVRILVLYDTSGSVTDNWPSAQARSDFEQALAAALVEAAGQAPFVVQVLGLGGTLSGVWAAPNATAIAATLASLSSTSDVWASVGQVTPNSGASAAILVSDCASSLEDPALVPGFQRALSTAGIPIAVVPIGTPDAAALSTIVTSSAGVELDPSDAKIQSALTEFVSSQVASRLSTNYRLRYRAPLAGAAHRSLQLGVAGRATPVESASYDVPAPSERTAASGVAGIYLTLTVAGVSDIRRLAGVELVSPFRPALASEPSAAHLLDCERVLNGITDILIEVPGATDAQRLDDVIGSQLTLSKLRHAKPNDIAALVAAAHEVRRLPWFGAALAEPLGLDADTTPSSVNVRVVSVLPSADGIELRSDLPPHAGSFQGVGADPGLSFSGVLRASVGASIRESEFLAESAAAALAGQKLLFSDSTSGPSSWPETVAAAFRPLLLRYDSFLRVVPAAGAPLAMWVIDAQSGSATAVWSDERGGGKSNCQLAAPADSAWLSQRRADLGQPAVHGDGARFGGGSRGCHDAVRLRARPGLQRGGVGLRIIHESHLTHQNQWVRGAAVRRVRFRSHLPLGLGQGDEHLHSAHARDARPNRVQVSLSWAVWRPRVCNCRQG
ncbi:MAG: hypothetical protein QM756_38860 [Polyangiaceae bacterium]